MMRGLLVLWGLVGCLFLSNLLRAEDLVPIRLAKQSSNASVGDRQMGSKVKQAESKGSESKKTSAVPVSSTSVSSHEKSKANGEKAGEKASQLKAGMDAPGLVAKPPAVAQGSRLKRDPKSLGSAKEMEKRPVTVIKEDIRDGRIYITAGIGGVVGSTSSDKVARVDQGAFQNASAAAYQGNSLTARFGRVDSDVAIVGMFGVGYDSALRNRGTGYSVGFEYLYQDKAISQRYSTYDGLGNKVYDGDLEVGEAHYIMAKFLGKYRIDSFIPYIGFGGGIALYNTRDDVGSSFYTSIFGDHMHIAPVVMPVAGVEYDLNQDWAITGEYKYLYCPMTTFNKKLKAEFKSLDTHNLVIGVKYGF